MTTKLKDEMEALCIFREIIILAKYLLGYLFLYLKIHFSTFLG